MTLLLSGVLALSGCGGGGGGGGGGSSSSSGGGSSSGGSGNTFTVSATSVAITAKRLSPAPSAVLVVAETNDSRTAVVAAAYRNGVAPAAWLDVGLVQINSQRYEFRFSVNSTGTNLDAGTYTTTVSVGSADSSGNVLHSRDIAVTLTLREGVRFASSGFGEQSSAGNNGWIPTRMVSVIAPANLQWTITSGAPWLTVAPGTRTGSADVAVSLDPSSLPGGDFETLLTATNVADATDTATTRVFFNVRPSCPYFSIKEFQNPGILGGTSGLDHEPMPVYFSLGTGTNQFGWSVTGPSWLRFDVTSGTGSSAESHFLANADLAQLAPGVHTGTLEVRSHVNGQTCINPIAITARVEPNRLLVSAEGVAFSQFPGGAVLQRTLRVLASRNVSEVAWAATSDAPWLAVTGSGTTAGIQGGALQLVATTTGLAPGQYFAEVTVVPANPASVQNTQQKVRVGLTIRATDPLALVEYAQAGLPLAANPVTPEFYATDGMGALNVHDVYSGALLRSFPGIWPGLISPRGDGRVLYSRNGGGITALDPQTGSVLREWSQIFGTPGGGLLYARPDAHPVLLTGNGMIVDLEADMFVGDNNDTLIPRDLSADQRLAFGRDPFASSGLYRARSLRYSSLVSQRMVYGRVGLFESPLATRYFQDVAVSKASGKVFIAAGGPDAGIQAYGASPFVPAGFLPAVDEHVSFVATSWNGRTASLNSKFSGGHVLRLYDDELTPAAPRDAGAGETFYEAPSLFFSGDGTRVISGTNSSGRVHAVN